MHPAHNRDDLGSNPRGPTRRRICMNPYEEAELEQRDLVCENCWCVISVREYMDNQGICDKCIEELSEE